MEQYKVQPGDTLSAIASRYGVPVSSIQGFRSGDPNLIYPNEVLTINKVSADSADSATPSIPGIPSGAREGDIVGGKVVTPEGTLAEPQTPFNISTNNPALQALTATTNKAINDFVAKGGVLTPEIQASIDAINNFETQKVASIAGGRTAAESKDAPKLNELLTKATEAETGQQDEIAKLTEKLETARTSYVSSLAPKQEELDLRTKLNTLRTERQLLPIELRREGISSAGIAGRQVEDERVRAIQEQNLLLEIGLKEKAREFETLAKEKQVGFIQDDIKLQQDIQTRLDKKEREVLDDARNLRNDSIKAMGDILSSFKGLAWGDLDPESQVELSSTAKQFSIPLNLLAKALEVNKQQQVFDNAVKLKKDTSITEANGRKVLVDNQTGAIIKDLGKAGTAGGTPTDIKAENYDQAKQEAITLFEADKARNTDKKISPDLYDAVRNKIPSTLKDDFDKWARDAGYLSGETMKRFGILPKTSDKEPSWLNE